LWLTALAVALLSAPAAAGPGGGALERARTALARSDYAQAEKELDAASRGADQAEAAYLRTRLLLWTGRYAEAAREARRGLRLGPAAKIQLAPWLAEALARQGRVDEAIAALREVEAEPEARRARLFLGELLIRQGKRARARGPLMTLVEDYNRDLIGERDAEALSMVGRAAHLLRSARDANDAYNQAERVGARKRVETLLWRAELYLDKYDPGHAAQVVTEALELAPDDPRARVAMAHVKLAQAMDFVAAQAQIDQALEVDPQLAEAHFVRAGLALRTMDLESARAAADAGLKVDSRNLELLSIKAAAEFLADDRAGFDALEKQVLDLNSEYSRFFQIVGEYAEWEHRYDEIVAMMRRAVAIDDRDAKAYAVLGLNLIRAGKEQEGLGMLDKAWRRDKFNVRVFNTRNLFRETIATDYVTVDGTPFRIRYHQKDKALLERYLPRMLEEAWGSMVRRYGFSPTTPVGIELYADAEHFAVRTSGLPHIGIQGVCFGKTLAALSPSAAPFNWGMVSWHELGHVFAIQLSRSRVPRWYTEGMSEYETIVRRPEWRREQDVELFLALRDGRLPKVTELNRTFTHVRDPSEVAMAYYASSQVVVYLAERFGFDKVVAALPAWGRGMRTPEVLEQAFGVPASEIDRGFRDWLQMRLGRYEKQFVPKLRPPESLKEARRAVQADPDNADKLVELALGLLAEGQEAEAEASLALALRHEPDNAQALYLKLRRAMRDKDPAEAQKLVDGLISAGHDGYAVRMKAADLAERQEDEDKVREHLQAAHRFDPSQAEPLQALYDLAHEKKDVDGELAALRLLSKLDQHDPRVWRRLLKLLVQRGYWKEAVAVGESALFVDLRNPEIHRLYARALARSGRFISAIYELNSAIIAGPEPAEAAAIYRMMAEGYRKLGRKEYAERAERYAVEVLGRARPPSSEDSPLRSEKGGR